MIIRFIGWTVCAHDAGFSGRLDPLVAQRHFFSRSNAHAEVLLFFVYYGLGLLRRLSLRVRESASVETQRTQRNVLRRGKASDADPPPALRVARTTGEGRSPSPYKASGGQAAMARYPSNAANGANGANAAAVATGTTSRNRATSARKDRDVQKATRRGRRSSSPHLASTLGAPSSAYSFSLASSSNSDMEDEFSLAVSSNPVREIGEAVQAQLPNPTTRKRARKLVRDSLQAINPSEAVKTVSAIMGLATTDITVKVWLVSFGVTFFLTCTYLYGVIAAARHSAVWEATITIAVPAITYAYFVTRDGNSDATKRTGELIFIESSFDVLIVLTKVSVQLFGGYGNGLLFWGFALFFLVQTIGFVRSEVMDRKPLCAVRSMTLFAHICLQWYTVRDRASDNAAANVIDAQGRVLVFGSDAPKTLVLHYFFWVLGVLYIDYRVMLPHAALQAVHLASVVVAAFSGEFWHARLLTASHLFVLDGILYFREGVTIIQAPFCTMPCKVIPLYDRMVPYVNLVALAGCVACLGASLRCGTDTFMCSVPDWVWSRDWLL